MSGTMLYRPGSTFLHNVDPRAKFFLILCVLVVALSTTRIDVLVVLTALVVIALAVFARITPRSYASALLLIVPLIVLLTLLQSIVQEGQVVLDIGGLELSRDGVLLGLGIGIRLFAMGICFYGFSVTTSPNDIALGLNRLGVPYRFAYLTSFAFRFLPLMQDEARTLLTAMALRGSSETSTANPFRRGRALVRMIFPMLVSSIKRSGDIALSMELRGYGLKVRRTYRRTLHFRASDTAVVLVVALVTVALITLSLVTPDMLAGGTTS